MAIATTAIAYVQSGGSDTNGGIFNAAGSNAGTNYPLANTSFAYTDLYATTTTTITSAARPFTSADVRNVINFPTATQGFTAGAYEITAVSGGAATLDRAIATGTGYGLNLGNDAGNTAFRGVFGPRAVVNGGPAFEGPSGHVVYWDGVNWRAANSVGGSAQYSAPGTSTYPPATGWVAGLSATPPTSVTAATTGYGTGTLGGAYATPGAMLAFATTHSLTKGYIKQGTYTNTTNTANGSNGALNPPAGFVLIGYKTTPDDLSKSSPLADLPLIAAGANSLTLWSSSNSRLVCMNVRFDGKRASAYTGVRGVAQTSGTAKFINCHFTSFTNSAFSSSRDVSLYHCTITDCATQVAVTGGLKADDSKFYLNTAGGITPTTELILRRCEITGNTGAGVSAASALNLHLEKCIFDGQSTHGLNVSHASVTGEVRDCVFSNNAGWGALATVSFGQALSFRHCATYLNTAGAINSNFTDVTGTITLGADPYTNRASRDFTTNSAATGGALLRAAAYSPTNADVGPYQAVASGGGSTRPTSGQAWPRGS